MVETAACPTDTPLAVGRVVQVNVSQGGVPKLPVEEARVGGLGVEGDRQREVTVHGGPHRAVSLLPIEVIRRVAAEGHPIAPGTVGENLTTAGIELATLPVGTRLAIGDDVVLELAAPANPCETIRGSFSDGRFGRLSIKKHPSDSRVYARVLAEGVVRRADPIVVLPPAPDSRAVALALEARLDAAEKASSVAFWRATAAAGHDVRIVDDGEVAFAASPSLPGPPFNHALGLAHLPNLRPMAEAHFRRHRTTGWFWLDPADAPGDLVDSTVDLHAARPTDLVPASPDAGVHVREVAPDDATIWADVVVASSGMEDRIARAWRDMAPGVAVHPHQALWIAELDGRPVAAAGLHWHRGVGWLRAASVLPGARGRGLQRLLIAARSARARELGCDLVGASALTGSVSSRNLAQMGLGIVGSRTRIRFDPSSPA
jgi:MOSC domain-containing protein YiiM/GNAT superfamily N-acetyltransferase